MPGESTRQAKFCQSRLLRSTIGTPAASAALRAASLSSHAHTRAPPAIRARQVEMPLRPRPKTATSFPSYARTGITCGALPQLQRGKARKSEQEGDDPEADDHGGFRPSFFLEVVVDRRHLEETLSARRLEVHDLDHHRERLDHEKPADDAEHQLVLHAHRHRAEAAAERERTRVA